MSNQLILKFAGDPSNLSNAFATVSADANRMADETSHATERMAERFDGISGQASLLSGGIGDVGGALTEAFGEDSGIGKVGSEMERYSAIVMGVVGVSDLLLFATNNLKLATIAKSVADKSAAAAQWLLNAAQLASPTTWIIVGILALVAVIVLIATKTRWFQTAWSAAWGFIKSAASNTWDFVKKIPGWTSHAFARIGDAVSRPFRNAFNAVARAWNATVGNLSWTVPAWVPGIGGNNISAPRLPTFHSGGVVPGIFGQVVPILAMGGERVSTGSGSAAPTPITAGDALTATIFKIIRDEIVARGGDPSSIGLVL
jgi:hypothetical protein